MAILPNQEPFFFGAEWVIGQPARFNAEPAFLQKRTPAGKPAGVLTGQIKKAYFFYGGCWNCMAYAQREVSRWVRGFPQKSAGGA